MLTTIHSVVLAAAVAMTATAASAAIAVPSQDVIPEGAETFGIDTPPTSPHHHRGHHHPRHPGETSGSAE